VVALTEAPTTPFTITPVPLTVASGTFTVADKVYDGTDMATITAQDLALAGFLPDDTTADVTWTPIGRFTMATAGATRTIELVGGAVLGGAKGGGYVLDVTGAPSATAAITPRPVTVSGASAAGRPYDGTTAVAVSGATLVNTVAGDAVTLAGAAGGTSTSPAAGTHGVTTAMTLAGADAANYVLATQPTVSVTITPLPVTVTMNPLPSRPYDRTTLVPLGPGAFSVSGVLPGETLQVSGTGVLSSRAVGTRTVTLSAPTFTPGGGASLGNYVLPTAISGTVTVTPRPLRVTGANVTTRVFDGTNVASVTGATLDGRALAREGSVTLQSNTITMAACVEGDEPATPEEEAPVAEPVPEPETAPEPEPVPVPVETPERVDAGGGGTAQRTGDPILATLLLVVAVSVLELLRRRASKHVNVRS
jgi:hypothetical protein